MKIVRNALSASFFNETLNILNKHSREFCWKPNKFFWPDYLMKGLYGTVMVSLAPEEYDRKFAKELHSVIPEFDELKCIFQCFDRGAGIAVHDDLDQYKWAATLYLNFKWNVNDGGIFCWKPVDTEDFMWKSIVPKKNLLVINDQDEKHFVTPVSPYSAEERYTVQIWAK